MLLNENEWERNLERNQIVIRKYIEENKLANTDVMLSAGMSLLSGRKELDIARHLDHWIQVCKMMLELSLPFSVMEMDKVLSASLGYMLCETESSPEDGLELCEQHKLDSDINEIVRILYANRCDSELSDEQYFERIQTNKYALIIKTVEIAVWMEQFFSVSPLDVSYYLRKIQLEYFPMCIYAKEHYPDLILVVSFLMEKVRLLLEVNEILASRFMDREKELLHEMLVLKEENARIRVSIRELENENIFS